MNILVIEDDDLTAEFIRQVLGRENHYVVVNDDGAKGFKKAQSSQFDAIILDINLPNMDGVTICRELRRLKVATPILFLSSYTDEHIRIEGLDAGADDYLIKPFSYKELTARLRAITRRPSIVVQSALSICDLMLNPESREVSRSGKVLKLSPKEYELLEYMMRNPDTALPRYLLLSRVWRIGSDSSSNRLEVYIRHLRQKVDHTHKKKLIQTVRGVGYKIIAS